MKLEEIDDALQEALPMRVPRFDPDTQPREKIAALEDYLLASAHVNGNLVAARHWLRTVEGDLVDQWERLEGWEVALKKRRTQATATDIRLAKVAVAPQLFKALREARKLRESVSDQIGRFEREAVAVSRAYTMISGG